jgi:hypothetical protein
MNIIGIDRDESTIDEMKKLQKQIEQEEHVTTLLYETKHGYHLELLYPSTISINQSFKTRKRYGDDKKRLYYSKKRYNLTGTHNDILFSIKNGQRRKLIG